jgi:DNA-directed RNA polymerase specialized sigma24 family protein
VGIRKDHRISGIGGGIATRKKTKGHRTAGHKQRSGTTIGAKRIRRKRSATTIGSDRGTGSGITPAGPASISGTAKVPRQMHPGTTANPLTEQQRVQVHFRDAIIKAWKRIHAKINDREAQHDIFVETLSTTAPYISEQLAEHGTLDGLDPYIVIQVAENKIRGHRARLARHTAISLEQLQERGADWASGDPELDIIIEHRRKIIAALGRLDARQILALVLRWPQLRVYMQELDTKEIATIMNTTGNNFYQLVHTGKEALREALRIIEEAEARG